MTTQSEISFRKSTFSGADKDCVEVGRSGDRMLVRDSKNPTGPVLSFTEGEWSAFLGGVAGGELGWDQA